MVAVMDGAKAIGLLISRSQKDGLIGKGNGMHNEGRDGKRENRAANSSNVFRGFSFVERFTEMVREKIWLFPSAEFVTEKLTLVVRGFKTWNGGN
ncbi:hypothetical protein CDAR_195021 [Caerostris darwini]|uniref:Uncharacterized protein n=1 Tax=Caerostris darwini TaxID=1538125 RepID=A0AAV4X941_9ARAC|nr:hypothetical protein CDAR_195021 [Caerostris darwini]